MRPQNPDAPSSFRSRGSLPGSKLGLAVLLWLGTATARADGPDTTALRFEIGASTDLTNEQFFEDTFLDSVSLGRQRVGSPESRAAMVMFGSVGGTRRAGQLLFEVQNELSFGNKLQRNQLGASLRADLSPDWRLHLLPASRVPARSDLRS